MNFLSHLFASCFDEIFKENKCFIDMSPVLAVVVESLPHHLHDFRESRHVVCQVGDLRHHGGRRTPGVVRRRLPHLDLKNNFQSLWKGCPSLTRLQTNPHEIDESFVLILANYNSNLNFTRLLLSYLLKGGSNGLSWQPGRCLVLVYGKMESQRTFSGRRI